MKKISTLLLGLMLLAQVAFNQHFVPVDLVTDVKNISVSIYGGLSVDASSDNLLNSLSNTGQTGFIVNALYKVGTGGTETFHQFIVDLNPIIVNWNPFTWNKLVKQPVDSFSVYKMPFQEDAILHIGWHKNYTSKFYRGGKNQLQNLMFFGEMYVTPYNVYHVDDMNIEQNYTFSVFNFSVGSQFSYIKKEVPTLGNFLIGASIQMNFMLTNSDDQNTNSLKRLLELSNTPYYGKYYMGPGGKIVVQTNFMNIYVEARQYFSIDNGFNGGNDMGAKFTQEPMVLVGAFGNLKWSKKKNPKNNTKNGNDVLE
jgi:hypothetical protein